MNACFLFVVVLILQETAEERVLIWEGLLIGKKKIQWTSRGQEGHKDKALCKMLRNQKEKSFFPISKGLHLSRGHDGRLLNN